MRSWRLSLGLCACSLGATLTAQEPGGPVFRTAVDSVTLNVAVTDHGRNVSDLARDEFEVRDNGVLQSVSEISRETLPIDVTLVVDLSGSVTGPQLASLQRAFESVRARLLPADRASLVTFNQHIREVAPPSPASALSAVTLDATAGQTSLLDAIAATIMVPADAERRQMAIVFTDGRDSTSFLDEPAVLSTAARSDVAVFTVTLYAQPTLSPSAPESDVFFKALTETTGGDRTTLRPNEDVAASFVRALEAFRTSYVLRYTLANQTRSGWHDLAVRVTRRGPFDVRARKGYEGTDRGREK